MPFAPHLFHNKQVNQKNSRKYIGIVLTVNSLDYFVPLSSFKDKHSKMQESVDFLKIRNYAVLNLNNMFPVPKAERSFLDINKVSDINYKNLLRKEYRIIKTLETKSSKTHKSCILTKFIMETKHHYVSDAMILCYLKKKQMNIKINVFKKSTFC